MWNKFRFGLRTKLAIIAVSLLALPWVGYQYVREMERFLLQGQQQALIATARAVATALHERPQLMRLTPPPQAEPLPESSTEMPPEPQVTEPPLVTESEEAVKPEAALDASERILSEAPLEPPVVSSPESPIDAPKSVGRESEMNESKAVADINAILKGLERSTARIWVVNKELKLLALAGSLKPADQPRQKAPKDPFTRAWRAVLEKIIPSPPTRFDDPIDEDVLPSGRDLERALLGVPASRVRYSRDGRAVIVSAAHPIWNHDNVVGAVVVEETTHSILAVRSQALERLLFVTLTVFVLGAVVLLGFASRLSSRIRRLRDEAESAIDNRGRLNKSISGLRARDEVGDLSRSFSTVLTRLSSHYAYLESLSSRLSHELRTPIAIVRSSLENLKLQDVHQDAQIYIERAEQGLLRLNRILTRMSEASRLEQSLGSTERERFDLARVVSDCVSGYRLAYASVVLDYQAPSKPLWVEGSPDLVAQLLDKLISNAVDFAAPNTPIVVCLGQEGEHAVLRIANHGVSIPEALMPRLFQSMVTGRSDAEGSEPHLGLGLYIARLIAEHHNGWIQAANLPTGDGVMMTTAFRTVART